jgi:hypothetical protein
MPSLSTVPPSEFVKLLLIGNSGTGKTGALISLVEAGYRLHIIDMDNGLAFVTNYLRKNNPKLLSNIDYVPCRDTFITSPNGTTFKPPAKAYLAASKLLDQWEDGTKPAEWGRDHVLVVDSLTYLGMAALNLAYTLMPTSASGKKPDGKQIYGMAGEAIMNFAMAVTSSLMQTNVILISHVNEVEISEGLFRGLPTTIGKAASEKIPGLFNDLVLVEKKGVGPTARRVIRTIPSATVDAKTAALDLPAELPLETGLATIFKAIRGD